MDGTLKSSSRVSVSLRKLQRHRLPMGRLFRFPKLPYCPLFFIAASSRRNDIEDRKSVV